MPGGQRNQWDKLKRGKDGTFRDWAGKRDMSYHGLKVHMGAVFKQQYGRAAKPGEAVRKKTRSGEYHQNSVWWLKGRYGWRRSPTNTKKPSKSEIAKAMNRAQRLRRSSREPPYAADIWRL